MQKRFVTGVICCMCLLCASCGNKATPAPTPQPIQVTAGTVVKATEESITIQTTGDATHTFERQDAQLKLDGYRLMAGNRVEISHRNPYEALVITLVEPGEEAKRYRKADDLLAGMSLEEKVGQLFLVRCPTQGAAQDAAEYHLGGYVLFKQNTENQTPAGLKKEIASYQEASKVPMLIAVDEEGGLVNRISQLPQFRSAPFRSPQALYGEGGLELIRSDTQEKARFLKKLGINVNMAPVCDVSTDSKDYIYARTFGKDADQTAEYVKTVVEMMDAEGMGSVLKHFPGYGNNRDTHTGVAHDQRPIETFRSSDFLPFLAGFAAGGDSVLVSHNVVEVMDPDLPASLSPKVHKLLREELEYDGVIMTDDLYMDAIRTEYGVGDAAVLAIQAGNDMICGTDYKEQVPAVIQAAQDGRISEEALDQSVLRILLWKEKLGLLQ
jgi:beta-N-acetylhexosaminidase